MAASHYTGSRLIYRHPTPRPPPTHPPPAHYDCGTHEIIFNLFRVGKSARTKVQPKRNARATGANSDRISGLGAVFGAGWWPHAKQAARPEDAPIACVHLHTHAHTLGGHRHIFHILNNNKPSPDSLAACHYGY